jgi:hypothetical protein
MNTRPLMTLRLATAPVETIGATPQGQRRIWPVSGGMFEGERLRGKVLAGGADWTTLRGDGLLELDLRITLETDDGALVHMTFFGMRDDVAGRGYFRTLPRFETAAPRYAFLNRVIAVGNGRIQDGAPVHEIEEVL